MKKLLKNLEKNNSISLRNFLISYCNICCDGVLKNEITHKDMKILFPYLKRVSYEYVEKNLKQVYTGEILLVKDKIGNIVPYIKPEFIEYDNMDIDIDSCLEPKEEIEEIIELENLNYHELVLLSHKYRELNRLKEYRTVIRMIKKFKKESGMDLYHKKKEKILLKRREEDDKY